ncbi:EamA family transporter [Alsobacter soli]|uniref:EamA family transporter n=1 Tax=Alsobacter soli TaxID=2109933 RepID=A0A2T1HVV4_9HYPH|nr:DMT family transporter [Alsobacter soli]PSC05748.1 EamA family transporter [Alsobacter soli]
MHSFAQNRRGVFALLAAMAVFTTNDSLMKAARAFAPAGQALFVRGVVATLCCLGLLFVLRQGPSLRGALSGRAAARAAFEAAVAASYVIALGHMPLADIVAIGQSAPILIAVACSALGLETMGWRRWASVMVGFVGVLLVVRPGGAGFDLYSVVALLSAACVAARDLVTRYIARDVQTVGILVAAAAAVCLSGAAMRPFETWVSLGPSQLVILASAGVLVAIGNYCIITAFRDVDVAVVSPFRYSSIVWATLSGALFFHELPDGFTVFGAGLVVGSGVYAIHRERVRARERTSPNHSDGAAAG